MPRVRRLRSLAFAFLFLVPALAHAQPGQATLVSSADAGAHTFTWNAVTGATYYHLWVNEGNAPKHQLWYTSAQAGCASGESTCRITVVLPNMNFVTGYWWIQTWSPAGYGPWSTARTFAIRPPRPAVVVDANGRYVGTAASYDRALIEVNGEPASVAMLASGFSRSVVSLFYPTNDCTGPAYESGGFDNMYFTSGSTGYLVRGEAATRTILSRRPALLDGTFGQCSVQNFSGRVKPITLVDLTSQFGSLTPPFKVVR